MPVRQNLHNVLIWTDDIDDNTIQQLRNTASMPFVQPHVAAMADSHLGLGACVGSVIPTRRAIIPAAVGVDIGCGVIAVQLSLKAHELPDNLYQIRLDIEQAIPLGAGGTHQPTGSYGPYQALNSDLCILRDYHPDLAKMQRDANTWAYQLGTLGSGNHFIELCLDEGDYVWIMLHSGSRGIGNAIGRYFINLAQREMERWHIQLPDRDLAYLPQGSKYFADYWTALQWAQDYARLNRELMMTRVREVLARHIDIPHSARQAAINCHHNYVALENHFGENVYVTRKGAIRAREGDLGVIPGSMGAKSYIVRGKGNRASFDSCSHGAGRRMSRTQARNTFTSTDLAAQTQGIECRKDDGVVDEIPAAYKDIDQVMANQTDLVDPIHTLRQILNVKG